MHSELIRKQYLISKENNIKLEKLSAKTGQPATHLVRCAIDAFDVDDINENEKSELMELVSQQLKEAIKATEKANKAVSKTLRGLS